MTVRMRAGWNPITIVGIGVAVGAGLTAYVSHGRDIALAAQIWGAYGTVSAVILALAIALADHKARAEDVANRAAAAAILISERTYKLRAMLSGAIEHPNDLKSNKPSYIPWLREAGSKFRGLPSLIKDEHLPFTVDLSPADLRALLVTDQWLRNFQQRILPGPAEDGFIWLGRFDAIVDEMTIGYGLVSHVTERIHVLSGMDGSPPWVVDVPSWATPRTGP